MNKGINLSGTLFIIFLILKLTETVYWSWWWVTAPLWGGLVASILILVILYLIELINNKL